jgi:hypothetical protein
MKKYLIAIKFNDLNETEIYEFPNKEDRKKFAKIIEKLYKKRSTIEIATTELEEDA